jgi:hypothetical protein
MNMGETAASDGSEQVLHGGKPAVAELQSGAKLTISNLGRLQPVRITAILRPAHPDAWLIRRLKGDRDLMTAV